MKTEYILTDEQKKRIAELNTKIFDLQMQIGAIYALASVRYVLDTDEEIELAKKYFSPGINLKSGVVKLNFERGTE